VATPGGEANRKAPFTFDAQKSWRTVSHLSRSGLANPYQPGSISLKNQLPTKEKLIPI